MANTRGEEWEKVIDAPSMKKVRERLRQLDGRKSELHLVGQAMAQRFRDTYPDAPFYLVKYSSKTLTDFRWRRSSSVTQSWRGGGGSIGVTVDLTSERGERLLEELPLVVRQEWLRWERLRVALNLALSVCSYEQYRVKDYADRQRAITMMDAKWTGKPK